MGDEGISNESLNITIGEMMVTQSLVNEWKEFYLREGHSLDSTTTYYNWIRLFVDDGRVISQERVDRFRKEHPSGVASSAVKAFLFFLVKKKKFPDTILHIYFDKTKTKRKMPQALDVGEVEKIIDAMGGKGLKEKYFTILLSSLGLRIGECLKLRFGDLNWVTWLQDRTKQGHLKLENTKGGDFRVIPVSSHIMELLYLDNISHHKTENGVPVGVPGDMVFNFGVEDFIFSGDKVVDGDTKETKIEKERRNELNMYKYLNYAGSRYRRTLNTVTKECLGDTKKVHPHMFRHSRAQSLMDGGLGIEYLKKYLGHSSISSTEVYAKASDRGLSEQIEEIDKK